MAYHNSVFGSKDGKLIETSDEVPARGNVASYKDAEGEDRKWVHRALLDLAGHAAKTRRRDRRAIRLEIDDGGGGGVCRQSGACDSSKIPLLGVAGRPGGTETSRLRRNLLAAFTKEQVVAFVGY